jgi:hypothetical protein
MCFTTGENLYYYVGVPSFPSAKARQGGDSLEFVNPSRIWNCDEKPVVLHNPVRSTLGDRSSIGNVAYGRSPNCTITFYTSAAGGNLPPQLILRAPNETLAATYLATATGIIDGVTVFGTEKGSQTCDSFANELALKTKMMSLLFTSTPAISFLQLAVDAAQPMDTSAGDGNVESHCPRPASIPHRHVAGHAVGLFLV